jgi:hypothetical protein
MVLKYHDEEAHELAHLGMAFHPCTCGLRRGVVALIDYDDVEIAAGMTTRRRRS